MFTNGITEAEQAAIYLPRPGSPFTPVVLASGERRTVWTTFMPQQLDIDVQHPHGRACLEAIL